MQSIRATNLNGNNCQEKDRLRVKKEDKHTREDVAWRTVVLPLFDTGFSAERFQIRLFVFSNMICIWDYNKLKYVWGENSEWVFGYLHLRKSGISVTCWGLKHSDSVCLSQSVIGCPNLLTSGVQPCQFYVKNCKNQTKWKTGLRHAKLRGKENLWVLMHCWGKGKKTTRKGEERAIWEMW